MPLPTPSSVRVVRIYSGAQMLSTRGITPSAPLQWAPLYPLSDAWSWADATGWCKDGTPERLLPPTGIGWSPTDGKLLGFNSILSADGMQVGLQPRIAPGGLAPNSSYTVTLHLIGATTGKEETFQIRLPTFAADALPPTDPTIGTFNGDVFHVAGIPIFAGDPT